MRHVTFYAIAVAALVLGGVALSVPSSPAAPATLRAVAVTDNDAASGTDAGNTPAEALVLGDRRNWNANLTPPGSDSDWYRAVASDAFCAVAVATTSASGLLTLAGSASLAPAISRAADPHAAARLVLAAPAGGSAFFGLEPPMVSRMTLEGEGEKPRPGRYTFSVATSRYADLDPQGDGESPEAGATFATAASLSAECSAGRLDAIDAIDTYTLQLDATGPFGLSFAIATGSGAHATVRSPSGAVVATLASGDAQDIYADQTGLWTVTVDATASSPQLPASLAGLRLSGGAAESSTIEYLLGVSGGPGDPAPCRPSCAR